MTSVLTVCRPASDVSFEARVRHVVDAERWDLDSPEGAALLQAVLRHTYPSATVRDNRGIIAGGARRAVVLDVDRDGDPSAVDGRLRWSRAVYDGGGAAAYREAVARLGEGSEAESIVEVAFRELRRSDHSGRSVEEGRAALIGAARRLAMEAADRPNVGETQRTGHQAGPGLIGASVRRGGAHRVLSRAAVAALPSDQRATLELAVLEELKIGEIAERTQATARQVQAHLNDALLTVSAGIPRSTAETLAHWRDALRTWSRSAPRERVGPFATAVAHAWLDYQVASHAVQPETVVLVTGEDRTFVATSASSGQLLGRPSVIGLRIDDITASHARPLVPELWSQFDTFGGMEGVYDCERPKQNSIRVPFRGIWGRPLPDLQVGYLQPGVPIEPGVAAS